MIRLCLLWIMKIKILYLLLYACFTRCEYNGNEHIIRNANNESIANELFDNLRYEYACVYVWMYVWTLALCSLSFPSFIFANTLCGQTLFRSLRHHFARCQPLLHVVTEDRGDVDEHQKSTRHPERQHRGFCWTWLHDGHCFVCSTEVYAGIAL